MKWKRNTGFDRIEDRRGQGGGGGFGSVLSGGGGGIPIPIPGGKAGGGIGGILIFVVIAFLLFSGVLGGGSGGLGGLSGLQPGAAEPGGTLNPENDTDQFLAWANQDIQVFWEETFAANGQQIPMQDLVLFEGSTSSGCGPASSATGPFYCPADQKIYLDLGFFDELQSRFGAQGGDTAIAYVVAHEYGHHVQTVLGISEEVQRLAQSDPGRRNDLSVRQELQADCLAGVWARSAASDMEPGDIQEAISAAEAVGDDRIQQSTTGRIDPEGWTHGSSEQRVAWFSRGYQTGAVNDCDTFAGDV